MNATKRCLNSLLSPGIELVVEIGATRLRSIDRI